MFGVYVSLMKIFSLVHCALAVADPGLSEGGFVLGKDIETAKSSTEIGCGVSPSPPH